MISTAKWIEREFTFDQPVWMFPNILERLRGTPARVEDRIASLPADILIVRPEQGWSVQEHLGHLIDVEHIWNGRLDDFAAGREELRGADVTNRNTSRSDYNTAAVTILLEQFRRGRMMLIQRLEKYDETFLRRTSLHPRLQKPMTVTDHAHFIAEHDDHHLAKITELKLVLTGKP